MSPINFGNECFYFRLVQVWWQLTQHFEKVDIVLEYKNDWKKRNEITLVQHSYTKRVGFRLTRNTNTKPYETKIQENIEPDIFDNTNRYTKKQNNLKI